MQELIEDVELSFKLFEFAVRTMCYAELDKIDSTLFGQDIQLNLTEENVSFSDNNFQDLNEIIKVSKMAVGTAFGSTAICLDCLLENNQSKNENIINAKSLISAVRNAFSHGIAAPEWYVKKHNFKIIDLSFINGPKVDLESLNKKAFDYSQIGGLAVWYRLKDYVLANT
ncbi:hypothetical protein [Catenovulum adriaticum]|uniref:MAE-28990/MAE-18760-like HEPN domain-containing protein n=1 Tax=Catenovulum adriaticum TaxID=2984846 RepID=A0ABY7AS99_9ALTE|nr:hypothetical protein [Catenovulum sp. TS8]WAJ72143.1 hypothetical protein OLW01_17840 [Catenovulum sp. TS8]